MSEPRVAMDALRREPAPKGETPGDTRPTAAPQPPVGGTPNAVARRARWRLGIVVAVLAGAFASLLAVGLGSSLNYFETVDQALAHKAALGTRTFRLEGVVEPGSIRRTSDGVAFVVTGAVHRVAVVNHGSPPQLFQPDIPVVVQGHFTHTTFVSDQVIVDHSAQYREQHPGRVKAPNGTTR